MSEQNWKYFEIGVNAFSGVVLLFSGHTIGIIAGVLALGVAAKLSYDEGFFK